MTRPIAMALELCTGARALDACMRATTLSPAESSELTATLGALHRHIGAMFLSSSKSSGADAPRLIAGASGVALGKAKKALGTMERIAALPEVEAAVADGSVSLDQAELIARALAVAPQAGPALLDQARTGSFEELRRSADQMARAARSEDDQVQKERRLYRQRRCRIWRNEEGAVCLEARFAPLDGARVMVALQKETDTVFRASWKAQVKESRERCSADALVNLVTGSAKAAGAQMVLRVDAAALQRGVVEGEETCEIEGVGQVSLASARALLPEAVITALVSDGTDIFSITSSKREIWRKLEIALGERDRCCVVPRCGVVHRLQIHHWRTDVFHHGPTEIDNLCRLCPVHHRLVTNAGYTILGGPGKWVWTPPGRAGPAPPG